MTDAPELKPCPFCGGEAEWKIGGPGCAFVSCKACPAETGDGSVPRILEKWNTRADQPTYDAGFAAGVEAAMLVVNDSFPDYEGGCSLQDQAARDLRDQIADDICALTPSAPAPVQEAAGFDALIRDAKDEAERAMIKFPQPNYVISKVAEEAGEVIKAAIHCAEGRESPSEVRAEMKQLIAMLYRLWVEGDEVHGLRALEEQEE